jgi:hypothetical protein
VKRKIEDMDDDICNYCQLQEISVPASGSDGFLVWCEGSRCQEAYKNYLETDDEETNDQ